ncbi:hypothetical protein K2173_003225 [Erythroxylum novogranatense]|uniref:YABBY protein C-terminal domain-containing protein n=1 Tax=Erythroxylum novogranatense TaxID=1862640 RepID=A0AAV8SX64_9ROSI|nr:hypothetical protein K2173_003225 [Erythroxylum novogranatense]
MVIVSCGHCTSLLSVNMIKTTFVPFHLLASLRRDDREKEEVNLEHVAVRNAMDTQYCSSLMTCDNEEDRKISENSVTNKGPEKRQRAPSGYNRFIKDEIRRLKAENQNMAHKEAFSTTAKNWANNPPVRYNEAGENCREEVKKATWGNEAVEVINY